MPRLFHICIATLAVCAALFCCGPCADAQASASPTAQVVSDPASTFSLLTNREPVTSLDGQWRFQPGDDSRWADPRFDDSHWALVNSENGWSENGYAGLTGTAWYRFRITLPAGEDIYTLRLPEIYTCYQLFVDGQSLLTQGKLPPHPVMYHTVPAVIDLPAAPHADPQTVTVALRVWEAPGWSEYHVGGLRGSAVVGRKDLIDAQFADRRDARFWEISDWLDLSVLDLLAFVIAFALFLSRRSDREYLWFSLLVLGSAGTHLMQMWMFLHVCPVEMTESIRTLFFTLFLVASLFFYQTLLGGRRGIFFKLALLCCALWFLNTRFYPAQLSPAENFGELLFTFPVYLWIALFVGWRAKQRRPDARLLVFPVALLLGALFYRQFIWTLQTAGLSFASHLYFQMKHPVFLTLEDVAEGFFLLAMLAILLSRFGRSRREQDRIASELEAARSMQHVLVPQSLPTIAGLRISTAYHPAEEVGGDFFQVLPMRSGGTLFVVGDVAGKGLPAALSVSLAVGALRTIADYTESPAEVLVALNRRLYGRGSGFTTCLTLHLSADRTILTVANAGHIPPYVNGHELQTEANLPLGLDPEATFTEKRYLLKAGDYVTALTDGVPEAMKGGELFGFERTHRLTRQPAAHIADAARSFGQQDDITVLTVEIASTGAIAAEVLQPA